MIVFFFVFFFLLLLKSEVIYKTECVKIVKMCISQFTEAQNDISKLLV